MNSLNLDVELEDGVLYKIILVQQELSIFSDYDYSAQWELIEKTLVMDMKKEKLFSFVHPKNGKKVYMRKYAKCPANGNSELVVGTMVKPLAFARALIVLHSHMYKVPYIVLERYRHISNNPDVMAKMIERTFNWVLRDTGVRVVLERWDTKGEDIDYQRDFARSWDIELDKSEGKYLVKMGCEVDYIGLRGKGLFGYLKNLPTLKRRIKEFKPDVIHAHYGLSGLLANLQRCVPVVTTYHGSDINFKKVRLFSKMAMRFSAWNFFVSHKTLTIAKPKKRFSLLPCGIDISESQLTEKTVARQKMGLSLTNKYILFAGAFDNKVKNAPLAKEATSLIHEDNVELLELKGYKRDEVTLLMCAADVFLMTSFSEGSPQVIKEALACG